MIVTRDIASTRRHVRAARCADQRIGFVPTMGALHAGHLSLIEAARAQSDFAVVSIFVNPTQFGPHEDFDAYPQTQEADLAACRRAGVDLVFMPTTDEMYPEPGLTRVHVDALTETLCGPYRPGHFDGVATVVTKLLNIVQPDLAFFGEKDAQQLAVIRRMVVDLDFPSQIVGCPTVREPDGLACSSRNRNLSPDDRRRAASIYQALQVGRQRIEDGCTAPHEVEQTMRQHLLDAGISAIDYASVVDTRDLQPLARVDRPVLLAVAVRLGGTRLIDNLQVDPMRAGR